MIYNDAGRSPLPLFNEKVLVGLASGMDKSGQLAAPNMTLATTVIRRFVAIISSMGVKDINAFATAAVREATNGADFVREIKRKCGISINVLDGEEEARLAALGVQSAIPEAIGLMGDLGGGSLELSALGKDKIGNFSSFPIGPLRLIDFSKNNREKANKLIRTKIKTADWLEDMAGQNFYAVGGSWRLLARIHMERKGYQPRIIHNYEIDSRQGLELTSLLSKLSLKTLKRIPGVNTGRLNTLPYAAYILRTIIRKANVSKIIFSAHGIREGILFDKLSKNDKNKCPLIAGSRDAIQNLSWPDEEGKTLAKWIRPTLSSPTKRLSALCETACNLARLGQLEHPDYRAEIVFLRILRMPLVGLNHGERAFIATAVASRHTSKVHRFLNTHVSIRLSDQEILQACIIGLGIRLFYMISGGSNCCATETRLTRRSGVLTLYLTKRAQNLFGPKVEKRLATLAKKINCVARIRVESKNRQTTAGVSI